MLTRAQIRIIRNTAAPEDAQLKKKSKGYAFIVYERERDMKGNLTDLESGLVLQNQVEIFPC